MAVISVTYNEGKSRSYKKMAYKSVNVSYGDEEKSFDSGNFEKDWYDMKFFIINDIQDEPRFSHSSSVNHFIMDNAPFDSAYLHPIEGTNNEEWEFVYWDETKHNYLNDSWIFDNGMEFFVKKGTRPTWKEFKAKYQLVK